MCANLEVSLMSWNFAFSPLSICMLVQADHLKKKLHRFLLYVDAFFFLFSAACHGYRIFEDQETFRKPFEKAWLVEAS